MGASAFKDVSEVGERVDASIVRSWQTRLRKLFKLANVSNGHAHYPEATERCIENLVSREQTRAGHLSDFATHRDLISAPRPFKRCMAETIPRGAKFK